MLLKSTVPPEALGALGAPPGSLPREVLSEDPHLESCRLLQHLNLVMPPEVLLEAVLPGEDLAADLADELGAWLSLLPPPPNGT